MILHDLGGLREAVEVDRGVSDACVVVAAHPHRDPREILEAEPVQLGAGQLAQVHHHVVLGAGRHLAQQQ
jgi:hypothetical protein